MTHRVKLSEIADVNPRGESVEPDEPVSFVGMAELDADSAIASPLDTRPYEAVSKGYTVFRDGDLLVAKITPCWENGKVGLARLDHPIGVGSTEFHVVRPRPHVEDRFLLHFLRQPAVRSAGAGRMTGSAGQRRVPADFLRDLLMPLPSIEEQRRIVGILDQLSELCAKRQRVVKQLDSLVGAIFADRFATRKPPLVSFSEIVAFMRNGLSPSTRGAVSGRVLTLSAITQGTFDSSASKYALFDREPSERVRVNTADFLICRGNGNKRLVGVGAHPSTSDPELVFPDTVIAARLDATRIDPDYLEVAWKQPGVRLQLESGARTTNGTHKVNQKTLGAVEVMVPSIGEQTDFASRTRLINDQRQRALAALRASEELFAALQTLAFRGGL